MHGRRASSAPSQPAASAPYTIAALSATFPIGKTGTARTDARPARGSSQHAIAVADYERGHELRRPEREERRAEDGGDDAERHRHCATRVTLCRERASPRASWRVPCELGRLCGDRSAFRSSAGEVGRVRSRGGIDREAPRPRRRRGGEGGLCAAVASGGAPAWMEFATSWIGHSPEGMPVGERLPRGGRRPTRRRLSGVASPLGEPLRGDVGQSSGHVPDRREACRRRRTARARSREADGELVAVLDEGCWRALRHGGRSRAMSVCQRVEHSALRPPRHRDRRARPRESSPQSPGRTRRRCTHGRVVARRTRERTVRDAGGALRAPLSARPAPPPFPFAGDDLERDVGAVPLCRVRARREPEPPPRAGAWADKRPRTSSLGGWGQPRRTTPRLTPLLAADRPTPLATSCGLLQPRRRSLRPSISAGVPWRRASTRDDDDVLGFDFFDEEDAHRRGRSPRPRDATPREPRGPGSSWARVGPAAAAQSDAASAPHRIDRARDPRDRPAHRRLDRGLHRERAARPKQARISPTSAESGTRPPSSAQQGVHVP